ncbi:hypothetical protein CDAR_48891 [Caerostris darwini]|uniref:Uncharacterized protein n=1 Tax=Caerostris darwini TaxID=1538125 RepID=A0AAV4NII1_9ARAC|nr:hypothetical protein CDAR_48891 [Caerostris darwini]
MELYSWRFPCRSINDDPFVSPPSGYKGNFCADVRQTLCLFFPENSCVMFQEGKGWYRLFILEVLVLGTESLASLRQQKLFIYDESDKKRTSILA